jgi:hypothetical protein
MLLGVMYKYSTIVKLIYENCSDWLGRPPLFLGLRLQVPVELLKVQLGLALAEGEERAKQTREGFVL